MYFHYLKKILKKTYQIFVCKHDFRICCFYVGFEGKYVHASYMIHELIMHVLNLLTFFIFDHFFAIVTLQGRL